MKRPRGDLFWGRRKGKKEKRNERLHEMKACTSGCGLQSPITAVCVLGFVFFFEHVGWIFLFFMKFTAIALVLMREAEMRVFASFSLSAAVALKAAMIDFPPFSPAHVVQQSGPPSRAIDPYWSPRAQRAPAHGEAREPHRNDWHQEAERGNEREGASLALDSKRNRQKNRSFIWYIIPFCVGFVGL